MVVFVVVFVVVLIVVFVMVFVVACVVVVVVAAAAVVLVMRERACLCVSQALAARMPPLAKRSISCTPKSSTSPKSTPR